ncbi:MAG: hypothetical protein ABR509_01525 [Candidatus Limnocylindria bacterium]
MTDEEKVRNKTLREVSIPGHWLYLLGVLGGGFVVMVAFMALLGGGG